MDWRGCVEGELTRGDSNTTHGSRLGLRPGDYMQGRHLYGN